MCGPREDLVSSWGEMGSHSGSAGICPYVYKGQSPKRRLSQGDRKWSPETDLRGPRSHRT